MSSVGGRLVRTGTGGTGRGVLEEAVSSRVRKVQEQLGLRKQVAATDEDRLQRALKELQEALRHSSKGREGECVLAREREREGGGKREK